jgi:hypothetical protein
LFSGSYKAFRVSNTESPSSGLLSTFSSSSLLFSSHLPPETHNKRQATQRGYLPSLLGDRDKGIELVYGEEKLFCTGPTRAVMALQKSLGPARQAQRTNQGSTPFICPH